MTGLKALWIPILLSAVIVFIASSIIHMLSGWHKNDFKPMPNEDKVRDALRPFSLPPGDYFIPRPGSTADLRSPEFLEKVKKGPVLVATVMKSEMTPMGRNLGLWFAYCVVVSKLAAYIVGRVLPPGTEYMEVFQMVSATAFMGYAVALWQMSIWYQRSWATTLRATVDGAVYALLTAGTFGWLWPK